MKLWCATGNKGKLKEFAMLAQNLELALLPDFDRIPPAPETGATFEENAIKKARYYGRYAKGLLFAEDSGLEVTALGNMPGVRSARFAGDDATDEANNNLLLTELRGITHRQARYRSVIALVEDGKVIQSFSGAVEGVITEAPLGTHGFGYDPLFYYAPTHCTFAELPEQEKNKYSHRSQAFARLQAFLSTKVDIRGCP